MRRVDRTCDWRFLHEPVGPKCDRDGVVDWGGYAGSTIVWFCREHDAELLAGQSAP